MARPQKNKRYGAPRSSAQPDPSARLPDVYGEMLRDALSTSPPPSGEERPIKRRRVGGRIVEQKAATELDNSSDRAVSTERQSGRGASEEQSRGLQQQTAYNDTEDSAESDIDWEEVDLQEQGFKGEDGSETHQNLNLVLNDDTGAQAARVPSRRRIATSAERQMKLDIHKMHLLCLLAHIYLRNHWCNDEEIHRQLRGLLTKRTVSYLNPDEDKSQFQRSRSFNDGLNQALDAFRVSFRITARGLSRSYWAGNADEIAAINPPTDIDLPMQKSDFLDVARKREASRDVGAQLFCALLRSVGVDVRLTCSFQVLPINASANTKSTPTRKPVSIAYYQYEQKTDAREENRTVISSREHTPEEPQQTIGSRGGRSRFASPLPTETGLYADRTSQSPKGPSPANKARYPKRIVESPYPIYWVEAFDEAAQKWIAVDPLVTKSVGKPRKLEPPASDRENNMVYVISFEDDGSARDVTKRYSKSFNAKTRRLRVEATTEGDRWLQKALNMYRRKHRMDRDQVEDTELARKEAQEGLPENVQDFKDHPYYALERHLRRNEVIHPKREVGKVSAGRGSSSKGLEPIYRRCDVRIVKSADKWYRMGREIKPGEQPLKRVMPRRGQDAGPDHSQGDDNIAGTALYTYEQTTEYKPPPVINGRLPKNVYGNLDIYVPSMVPAGAIHLKHPDTQRAARFLGIDYADAVTGFAFKGRHGTAVINGAVVAAEHADAVQQLLIGFEDERAHEEETQRSLEALRMWKRFLAGLRIRQRIEGYDIEGDDGGNVALDPAVDDDDDDDDEDEDEQASYSGEGGFLPDSGMDSIAEPTAGGWVAGGGGQDSDNEDTGRGFFLPPSPVHRGQDHDAGHEPVSERSTKSRELDEALTLDDDTLQTELETASNTADNLNSSTPIKRNSTTATQDPGSVGDDHLGLSSESRVMPEANPDADTHATTSSVAFSELGIAHEDLEEATLLQRSYDLNRAVSKSPSGKRQESTSLSPRPRVETQQDPDNSDSVVVSERLPQAASSSAATAAAAAAACSTPDGSQLYEEAGDDSDPLLSEDPSDVDADPEWIA
ncbi:MAG: hypothetical protein Q9191_003700 [Dirinaria sp. TL-2023a]